MFKIDKDNMNILDSLKKVNPKLSDNFFHKNQLVEGFVKHEEGGIDLMKQPVCEKCERPGTWNKEGGYCFSCNHTTKDPKKVEEYLTETLEGLDVELIKLLTSKGE